MKKTTIINHTFTNGKSIKLTIERIHGWEPVTYNLDGDKFDSKEFKDCYKMSAEYEGKTYTNLYPVENPKAPFGRSISLTRQIGVCFPLEKWAEIDAAIAEKLTEELSPKDAADIKKVKEAIASNQVLPRIILENKRRDYDRAFNEGGEGYNPYNSYVTTEWTENIKAKFHEHF